jgi:HlyD family secretion protein
MAFVSMSSPVSNRLAALWRERRLAVLVVGALVVGGVLFQLLPSGTPVTVASPQVREVVQLVIATGRLRAVRESPVGAELSGVVDEVKVREGDSVKAGDVLAVLNEEEQQARVDQARQSLAVADANLSREQVRLRDAQTTAERTLQLFRRGNSSEAQRDQTRFAAEAAQAAVALAVSQREQARAALNQSEANLSKLRVTAPLDGIVITRNVEPGQSVTSNTVMFRIAEMANPEIYVETDENNLGRLAVGQRAFGIAPAYPQTPIEATVSQVGPNIDRERGVVGIRLKPVSLPSWALPNMTLDVNIQVARYDDKPAVPASAVVARGPDSFVLLAEGGRAVERKVDILGRNPQWVALAQLPADARVIQDAAGIANGAKVKVETAAAR